MPERPLVWYDKKKIMIKLARIIRYPPGFHIEYKDYMDSFDSDFLQKSLKRISAIKVRTGESGDDFYKKMQIVVLEARGLKIPRFMNPVRGRRHGKTKK